MGLDVYLHKCPDLPFARKQRELYVVEEEKVSEQLNFEFGLSSENWSRDFDLLSKKRQDEYWGIKKKRAAPIKAKYGIGDYEHESITSVELPSRKYPDHLFKRGYFRSSYNASGYDNYARRLGLPSLSDIFKADGQSEFVPDWKQALQNAKFALELIEELDNGFDVVTICPNAFLPLPKIKSENEALTIFNERYRKWMSDNSADKFVSLAIEGHYFTKGIDVYGAIPGVEDFLGRKLPCTYLIVKREGGSNWHKEALEIVVETCEHVLAQPDADQYYLYWSG